MSFLRSWQGFGCDFALGIYVWEVYDLASLLINCITKISAGISEGWVVGLGI